MGLPSSKTSRVQINCSLFVRDGCRRWHSSTRHNTASVRGTGCHRHYDFSAPGRKGCHPSLPFRAYDTRRRSEIPTDAWNPNTLHRQARSTATRRNHTLTVIIRVLEDVLHGIVVCSDNLQTAESTGVSVSTSSQSVYERRSALHEREMARVVNAKRDGERAHRGIETANRTGEDLRCRDGTTRP